MTTQNTTPVNFFTRIWDSIVDFFSKELPSIEQSVAKFGNALTNQIKAIENNTDLQAVLTGIATLAEAIDPALVPMVQGLELEVPKILNLVTGVVDTVDAEVLKPLSQQVIDALTKLKIIKASPSTGAAIYAGAVGTISTAIQHYITTNNGILATPSQLITSAQAAHA